MPSFADFADSVMAEVSLTVNGEPTGMFASYDEARSQALVEWARPEVTLIEFVDAGAEAFETWRRETTD